MYFKCMVLQYPFYQYYSWWAAAMVILYCCKVIPFSVLPSALLSLVGAIIFLIVKWCKNKYHKYPYYNYNLALCIILLHLLPVLVIPFTATITDCAYNLIIFIVYLVSLRFQNTNVIAVYTKMLNWDDKTITVYSFYKESGLLG
jgi:hypothetical protein